MKKIIPLFSVLALLFLVSGASAQQITLTSVPLKLIGMDESVTITWYESVEATLHYGTSHGNYDHALSYSGTQSISFVPSAVGMGPGVYYAVISNGNLTSAEFKLIVESPNAPTMTNPANNSTIETATPEFQWDEVQGVPFYHIVVSDHEPTISRDENGNLQVTGANIIWQAITPETHITYGSADPSGFFTESNGTTPPLMSGITYTWIVLNNYGNNPAYTSIVQGGVFTFTVNLQQTLNPPDLVAPADDDTLSSEAITFQWTSVDGAVNYQIYLYEFIYQDNSSSSILIWNSTTSNTSIEIPARQILKGTKYLWRVLAIDNSGNGYASETRSFFYEVPIGAMKISSRDLDSGGALPSVNILVTPISGSGNNISYVTSQNGNVTISVQPGEYSLKASKEGYLDTTKTVKVPSGDTVGVTIYLKKSMHQILGQTVSTTGAALSDVQVTALEIYLQKKVTSASDANGNFVLDVPTGTWEIWAHKEKYSNSDTVQLTISSEFQKSLDNPLVLKPFDALISGKVINDAGNAVLGANVQLKKNETTLNQQTDAGGLFQFQVSSGDWTLTVSKEGFISPPARTFHVEPGDTVNVSPDIVLEPNAGVISGFVFDGSRTVGGALVKAVPASGLPVTTQTDQRGYYSLSVAPGIYSISVSKQNYTAPAPVQVNLQPGQTLSNVNFSLTPNPVFISGWVTSKGNPIKNAIVHAGENSDTTLTDGSYKIWVQPGFYQIWVTKPGYVASEIETLTVHLGENRTNVNFELTRNAGTINGKVYEGSEPIPDAFVMAFTGSDSFFTQTNDQGAYTLTVKPGTWKLLASKQGFLPDTLNVEIPIQAGQTVDGIDFNLVKNIGTISGRVLDDSQKPLVNASVFTSDTTVSTVTDNNGNFTMQVEPGHYQLVAQKTGFSTQTKSVDVKLNQTAQINFTLTSMGSVFGTITNQADQKPVDKAIVLAISGGDTIQATSDYTGEYRLHLKDGSYKLVFDKLGFKAFQTTKAVRAGIDLRLDVQLVPDPSEIATLSGRILADDKTPMRGIPLVLSGAQKATFYSDDAGQFEIKDLPTGFAYTLKPQEPGYFFSPKQRVYSNLKQNHANQNFVGSKYGDVTGNGKITSYDATLVLSHIVGKEVGNYFKNLPRDSIAADVSGTNGISALDASLIFQYAAHLIGYFPVASEGMPKIRALLSDGAVHEFSPKITGHVGEKWEITLSGANMAHVYSTEWHFRFDPKFLSIENCSLGEGNRQTALAWAVRGGTLAIATASLKDSHNGEDFIRLQVRTTKGLGVNPLQVLRLADLQINEGRIKGELSEGAGSEIPNDFALLKIYPNPFVESATIAVSVPAGIEGKGQVIRLSIYNVLGQKIRDIVDAQPLAPGLHSFTWNGLDNQQRAVVNGVYFCRLEIANQARVQKLIYMHR